MSKNDSFCGTIENLENEHVVNLLSELKPEVASVVVAAGLAAGKEYRNIKRMEMGSYDKATANRNIPI